MNDTAEPPRQAFLLRHWWVPLAVLAAAAAVAAWIYRDRPVELADLPAELLRSGAAWEESLGALPARRIEYTVRRSTELHGRHFDGVIRSTLDHLGQGLMRRHDEWYEVGGQFPVYQERHVLHRNLFQVRVRWRELAPFVHDLLKDFGWIHDMATGQTIAMQGRFPADDGSTLSVRQVRLADTDGKTLQIKPSPYERSLDCRRDGSMAAAALGPAASAAVPRVRCQSSSTGGRRGSATDYVWLPDAGIFLLLGSESPTPVGGTETVKQVVESLRVTR